MGFVGCVVGVEVLFFVLDVLLVDVGGVGIEFFGGYIRIILWLLIFFL